MVVWGEGAGGRGEGRRKEEGKGTGQRRQRTEDRGSIDQHVQHVCELQRQQRERVFATIKFVKSIHKPYS